MVLDKSWYRATTDFGHRGVTTFHFVAFVAGLINFFLNGLIWKVFASSPRLLAKGHLYLFYAFAVCNCLTGFSTVPTYINLYLHNNLNCPRWSILLGSSFEIALDRIRAVITLAISLERILAIFLPGSYFFMDHKKVAVRTCYFAIAWGLLDAFCMIFEDDVTAVRAHCVTTSSSGPLFHWYFLISNILSGLLLIILYFVLFCRLVVMKRKLVILNRKMCKQNQAQANSLTIGVILIVLIFSVLPCCLYLYDMIVGEVVFMQWGPIVTIGYHCYGILSFFFYSFKHRDIRHSFCAALRKPLNGVTGNSPDSSSICCSKKNNCAIRVDGVDDVPVVLVNRMTTKELESSNQEIFL